MAEIFEADDCALTAEDGLDEMLGERSNLKLVGELRPVAGIEGEYAPLLGPEPSPPPPPAGPEP